MNEAAVNPRIWSGVARVFLWVIPLPFIEATYRPGHLAVFLSVGALQAGLIAAAAITLRRDAPSRESAEANLIPAAALFISGWALASLAFNMGDPPRGDAWLASVGDQYVRYAALVCGALVSFSGVAVLSARVRHSRERQLVRLALATSLLSTGLFIAMFIAYPMLVTERFALEAATGQTPSWWPSFAIFLSSGGLAQKISAGVSTIVFAIVLRRLGHIGRAAVIAVAAIAALMAVAPIVVHIPPALAFVPPYLLGASLLNARRISPAV